MTVEDFILNFLQNLLNQHPIDIYFISNLSLLKQCCHVTRICNTRAHIFSCA